MAEGYVNATMFTTLPFLRPTTPLQITCLCVNHHMLRSAKPIKVMLEAGEHSWMSLQQTIHVEKSLYAGDTRCIISCITDTGFIGGVQGRRGPQKGHTWTVELLTMPSCCALVSLDWACAGLQCCCCGFLLLLVSVSNSFSKSISSCK